MEWLTVSAAEPEREVLARAAGVLSGGGLVVFPTDTLYGLAADPRAPTAIARVFRTKGRVAGQALPLIAADLSQVEAAAMDLSAATRRLAERFWPGPLSLVVDAGPMIDAAVHAGTRTVAVRVPAHAVARALAASLGFAVIATSANRSGAPAARTPAAALVDIGHLVDLVLDAGPTPGGEPSTIVDVRGDAPVLIREGAVTFARVLEAL